MVRARGKKSPRIIEFRSSDPDQVRDRLGNQFTQHTFKVRGRTAPVDTVLRSANLGDVSVSYVQYSAPVEIEQTVPEDIFMVGRPLHGILEVKNGGHHLAGGPPRGAVLSMNRPNRINGLTSDLRFRVVRIERGMLERHLAHLVGHELSSPLDFRFALPANTDHGWAWWGFIEHLWESAANGTIFSSSILVHEIEQLLKTMLLTLQLHNHTESLRKRELPAAPFYVRRAEDYIYANTGRPTRMDDLVAASGVSFRSLYAGFKRFRGTTPMGFLRWHRLDKAHVELMESDPRSASVASIARKYGFLHLGHFAAAYRKRYSESPSATLRRA